MKQRSLDNSQFFRWLVRLFREDVEAKSIANNNSTLRMLQVLFLSQIEALS